MKNSNKTTSRNTTSFGIHNSDGDFAAAGGECAENALDVSYYEFVRYHLPKVELHAHLNGCIPVTLLQELAHERGVTLPFKYFRVVDATTTNQTHPNTTTTTAVVAPDMYNLHPRSLQDCFDVFAALPAMVNDLTAVRRITYAALQDFAHHHVAYLELRSTPKRLLYHYEQQCVMTNDNGDRKATAAASLCTKQDYCQTILQVMHDFQEQEQQRYDQEMVEYHVARRWDHCGSTSSITNNTPSLLPRLPLVCRFLVSIDRSQSLAEAEENVNLAIDLAYGPHPSWSRLVVGIDLGGNPTRSDFRTFQPCLQKARNHGLKVTLHCGEIPCDATLHPTAYREASDMLDFGPDRLGHAVLLPPDLLHRLEQLQIPVETCPTSNVMTLELHHQEQHEHQQQNGDKSQHGDLVHGLRQHPSLQYWLRVCNKKESNNNNTFYPLTIGTDDPGVFDTTATQELWLLATAFQLDRQQLGRIIVDSVRYAFCDVATQTLVHERIRERVRAILS